MKTNKNKGSISFCSTVVLFCVADTRVFTFSLRFTEDGIMFIDGIECDVLVVDNVLRIFEAVVSAQEMVD